MYHRNAKRIWLGLFGRVQRSGCRLHPSSCGIGSSSSWGCPMHIHPMTRSPCVSYPAAAFFAAASARRYKACRSASGRPSLERNNLFTVPRRPECCAGARCSRAHTAEYIDSLSRPRGAARPNFGSCGALSWRPLRCHRAIKTVMEKESVRSGKAFVQGGGNPFAPAPSLKPHWLAFAPAPSLKPTRRN